MYRSRRIPPAALAALSILFFPACGPVSDDTPRTASRGPSNPDVDAVFADLDRNGPGAAVGVLLNGEVVHRAGYGIAHLDHGVPITAETVFDIASISKQFGAMSALLLEAEGKLDLDEDVRAYVPELPDFGVRITPRHLIHHTSGIRDWVHVMDLSGVERSDVISFEKILRMLFEQRAVNFPPGSEHAYSNTGYNLLARVIEAGSGMTFREFTKQRIFEPLGMSHTHFSDDHLEVVPGRAESYSPVAEGAGFQRQPNQLTALASSSLNTTIDDFIRWMLNYQTGEVGGEDIVRTMLARGVLTSGDTLAYAHGLTVGAYRGLRGRRQRRDPSPFQLRPRRFVGRVPHQLRALPRAGSLHRRLLQRLRLRSRPPGARCVSRLRGVHRSADGRAGRGTRGRRQRRGPSPCPAGIPAARVRRPLPQP